MLFVLRYWSLMMSDRLSFCYKIQAVVSLIFYIWKYHKKYCFTFLSDLLMPVYTGSLLDWQLLVLLLFLLLLQTRKDTGNSLKNKIYWCSDVFVYSCLVLIVLLLLSSFLTHTSDCLQNTNTDTSVEVLKPGNIREDK